MSASGLHALEVVTALVDLERVKTIHTNQATYSTNASGRLWVRKRVARTGWEELLAEALSTLLAWRLELPVPNSAVCLETGEESWLSECIAPIAGHWSASNARTIENLGALGGLLTLDLIVHNADRHARNILLQATGVDDRLHLWGIDFGQALVGWQGDFAKCAESLPSTRNLAPGLPLHSVRQSALQAAARARVLPEADIRTIV